MDNHRLMYGDIVLTTFKKGLLGVIVKVEQDESDEDKYIILIRDGSIVDYIVATEKDILLNIHLERLKEYINFYSSIINCNKEEK